MTHAFIAHEEPRDRLARLRVDALAAVWTPFDRDKGARRLRMADLFLGWALGANLRNGWWQWRAIKTTPGMAMMIREERVQYLMRTGALGWAPLSRDAAELTAAAADIPGRWRGAEICEAAMELANWPHRTMVRKPDWKWPHRAEMRQLLVTHLRRDLRRKLYDLTGYERITSAADCVDAARALPRTSCGSRALFLLANVVYDTEG